MDCSGFSVVAQGGHEPGSNFNSQGLGLRAQKKILGKMASKKIAKAFIDDDAGALLDAVHVLARRELETEKEASKLLKNIIKIVIKLAVLYRNDQFNAEELALGEKFKGKFRQTAMTVVSFRDVEFSYDEAFLQKELEECETMLHQLIKRHLTEKSHGRVTMVFGFFRDAKLLDKVFTPGGEHWDLLNILVTRLNLLMEQNKL
jgi:hypothetical protein